MCARVWRCVSFPGCNNNDNAGEACGGRFLMGSFDRSNPITTTKERAVVVTVAQLDRSNSTTITKERATAVEDLFCFEASKLRLVRDLPRFSCVVTFKALTSGHQVVLAIV